MLLFGVLSTVSSLFIQWNDLHVRIQTTPALRAVGVLIRTCRSFPWMNTSDKVGILYVMTDLGENSKVLNDPQIFRE